MTRLTLDPGKCNLCGICMEECPLYIIEADRVNALPVWIQGGDTLCVKCGHCVISCPKSAIEVDSIKPEHTKEFNKDLLPSFEQMEMLLKSRRSIRVYKEKRVSKDIIASLIDVSRYAPSGHNTQPVQWLVIQDTKEVNRLAGFVADWMRTVIKDVPTMAQGLHLERIVQEWDDGRDRIMRNAPHAIVAFGHKDNPMAPQAGIIALTTLELAVHAQGLGACWAGYFHVAAISYPPMIEALNLPEGCKCLGAMMIGYPKHKFFKIPPRNEPQIIWR